MEKTENKKTAAGAAATDGLVSRSYKPTSLPVSGTLSLNENGYLLATLDNPFADEPLGSLNLTFQNPSKLDRFGQKDDDRRGAKLEGALRFCTRKADGEVRFTGACTYNSMTDKKGNVSDFISVHINNPFPDADINGGEPVRVFFKNGSTQGEFDLVAMSRLECVPVVAKAKRRF